MGIEEKYRRVVKMIFKEIGLEKEPTIQDIRIFMHVPYNKLCAKFVLEDLSTMTQGQVMNKYGITLDAIRWIKIVRKTTHNN
jgi:hypothetical protein